MGKTVIIFCPRGHQSSLKNHIQRLQHLGYFIIRNKTIDQIIDDLKPKETAAIIICDPKGNLIPEFRKIQALFPATIYWNIESFKLNPTNSIVIIGMIKPIGLVDIVNALASPDKK